VFTSPAVYDGTVYYGSEDHHIYARDAATGALDCDFDTGGRVEASPVVADIDGTGPIVFDGDTGISEKHNAGHEWALNGVGNQNTACSVRWSFDSWNNKGPYGNKTGTWSSPSLGTDSTGRYVLAFGSTQPDDSVYELDALTGAEIWRFQTYVATDSDVGAAPTISAPRVNGLADGAVYVMGKDRIEYAIDLATGAEIWNYSFRNVKHCSTDAESGTALVGAIVVVNYCKWIYALDAAPTAPDTTTSVWRSPPTGHSRSSPVIAGAAGDQVVIRGDRSGNEDAFKLSTGALLTPFFVGATTSELSSTAVSNGRVVFAATDGNVYILG
jgi:outer membrane protein assembly factor BamB